MSAFVIPAWLVSASALFAAACLLGVRPMWIYVRVGLIIPIVYFAIIYWCTTALSETGIVKIDLVRGGLIALFLDIGFLSLIYIIEDWRVRRLIRKARMLNHE
jgi:hypothetical protein